MPSPRLPLVLLVAFALAACVGTGILDEGADDAGTAPADASLADDPADAGRRNDGGSAAGEDVGPAGPHDGGGLPPADAGGAPDAGPAPCPADRTCVSSFPFGEDRDTSTSPLSALAGYSCAPSIDEGGPEIVYQVTVFADGFLSAAVDEASGVDVDVHLLRTLHPADCVDRGNSQVGAEVTAGTWFVVVDTYRSDGVPQAGAFHVDIGLLRPSRGSCALQSGSMPRVGDGGDFLAMPATGPVVVEAHLVTREEPPPYPSTATEELAEHYALSQARTGLVMHRSEPWAPLEGGTFYGCGIGSPTAFPVEDEGWYVNMYWTSAARPAKGTKMILRRPGTNRAVVLSAGYETGPSDLAKIGGTTEEAHFYLGGEPTLTLGIAVDQSLPLGPRVCE